MPSPAIRPPADIERSPKTEQLMAALTLQQRTFIELYFQHGCNAAAAVRAMRGKTGPGKRGDPEKEAARAFTHQADVQAAIASLRADWEHDARLRTATTVLAVSEVAHADLGDLVDEAGQLRPLRDIPAATRRALAGVKVRRTAKGTAEIIEYKLFPKVEALGLLARIQGLVGRTSDEPPAPIAPGGLTINFHFTNEGKRYDEPVLEVKNGNGQHDGNGHG